MRRVSEWASRGRRVGATVAALTLVGGALAGLAKAVGIAEGFGPAQKLGAEALAARPDDWRAFRRSAMLDLFVFVPAYTAAGVGVAHVVVAHRSRRAAAVGLLAAGAVADLVETIAFHRALSVLLDGAGAEAIGTETAIAGVAFWAKYAALGGSVLVLLGSAAAGD